MTSPTEQSGPPMGMPEWAQRDGASAYLRKEAFRALEFAIRSRVERRGEATGLANRVLDRLTAPARDLARLREVSKLAFGRGTAGKNALRSVVQELQRRWPRTRGSRAALELRTTARGSAFDTPVSPGGGGMPCGVLDPEGPLPIYVITHALFQEEPQFLDEATDLIVGLSMYHGQLESVNTALASGDLRALDSAIEPYGMTPDPDAPIGGGGLGGFGFPWERPGLPDFDPCEMLRELCEQELIAAVQNRPSMPQASGTVAWADNISHITETGHCDGDRIMIHGSGFGDPKPANVQLSMRVDGKCRPVPTASWTDTQIEVDLPAKVQTGAIGFVDTDVLNNLNGQISNWNNSFITIAKNARCLGDKLPVIPLLPMVDFPCAINTGKNYLKAGLPSIGYFFAYSDTIQPDEPLMLRFRVDNAETVTLRRVSAVGPTFDGNVQIVDPPSSTLLLTPEPFDDVAQIRYQLRASTDCGPDDVREVIVAGSKKPELAIVSLEVTQGIQTMDNDEYPDNGLRLVANKPTVVRMRVSHGLGDFAGGTIAVRGRLRVGSSVTGWTPWLDPINGQVPPQPMPQDFIVPRPEDFKREETDHTMNFLLPTASCQGTATIEAEVWVDDFGADPQIPDSGFADEDSRTIEVTFAERRKLTIFYSPWKFDGVAPTDEMARETVQRAAARLPTPEVILGGWTIILGNSGGASNPDSLGDLYELLALLTPCDWYDLSDSLYGACTKGTDIHALMVGPVGEHGVTVFWDYYPPRWGWPPYHTRRKSTRYFFAPGMGDEAARVSIAAHELGHVLNDEDHVALDEEGEFGINGYLVDVPFDIANNTTVSPGHESYPGVPEMLTSAKVPLWPSPERWEWAFDKIGG